MPLRLDSLRDELAGLHVSIAHRRHPLEKHEHRRAVVEAELALYTYPILTLPLEITSEIFMQSLPSHGAVVPHPSSSPLILLRICRTWRILALSTPTLWTDLYIAIEGVHRTLRAPGKLETFVEAWFHRARTLPCSFHFFGMGDHNDDHGLNMILATHAAHLREITISIDAGSLLRLHGGTPFAILHHLSLHTNKGSFPSGAATDVFRLAPQRRSLHLGSVPPSALTVPWEQLTTFSARFVELEECLGVLRKAHCLSELSLWDVEETQATSGPPFSHPGLISLKLSGRSRSRGIIRLLALPNLQRLQLRELSAFPDDTIPLQFISSSSLHTFAFGHNTPMVTLPWLRVMEHLTSLELGDPLWVHKEDLVRALDRAHEPRFLPKLEVFTLSCYETHEFRQRLLAALMSRCGPTAEGLATLKSFYISDGETSHGASRRSQPLLFQSITTV
ncbi:hypothetical protein C8J57DRAFT_1581494 [Mycena rebaudengoi]|nr:hypothetical protein C8J57DRAFT_1581494 [Mycena rebaudengoi]